MKSTSESLTCTLPSIDVSPQILEPSIREESLSNRSVGCGYYTPVPKSKLNLQILKEVDAMIAKSIARLKNSNRHFQSLSKVAALKMKAIRERLMFKNKSVK